MKKVYCKNCKYSGNSFQNGIDYGEVKGWQWCSAPQDNVKEPLVGKEFTGMKEGKDYNRGGSVRKSELNSKGECSRYKRKWWRKLLNLF
jgi:hypothetical protein